MASNNNWDELLGSKNWEGLLNPLDDSLRDFITHHGTHVLAASDAFNDDPNHPSAGRSKYDISDLLTKTFFPLADDYTVTHLLEARTVPVVRAVVDAGTVEPRGFKPNFIVWSTSPTFMGYVAVSSDAYLGTTGQREIVVAWRGTRTGNEWYNNLVNWQSMKAVPLGRDQETGDPMVNTAWMNIYEVPIGSRRGSARDQVREQINELVKRYQDEKSKLSIIFVGHSLGGALAILSAFDIVELGLSRNLPVCAMVFGCPKIGNKAFFDRIKEKLPTLKILSVENKFDLVPTLPPSLPGDWPQYFDKTAHAVLQVDFTKVPYLRPTNILNLAEQHDLASLLYTVGVWNIVNQEFKGQEEQKRSLATANKYYDMLVPEEAKFVPVKWFQQENKGMVMDKDGNWFLQKHA